MKNPNPITWPETEFWRAYRGSFKGILTWEAWTNLYETLVAHPGGWHVFDPQEAAPDAAMAPERFLDFLAKDARTLVESRRDLGHCGSVYVDDPAAPAFVKVFDPSAMGSACSTSTAPVFPRWVLSQIRPETLPRPEQPARKTGLLGRLSQRFSTPG